MGYLVAHIAAYLVFAQLLGLLLGWLLWGYPAREHAKEARVLRDRLTGLQMITPQVPVTKTAVSLPPAPEVLEKSRTSFNGGGMLRGQLEPAPGTDSFHLQPETAVRVDALAASPAFIAPDLDAEVKEARLRHFQQQIEELEGVRDRLPSLEAALSDAVAGRRAAESKIEEIQEGFETRLSSLLSQIRNFETAAQEWNRLRDDFEHALAAREKELVAVRAHLRDIQNSQLPQKAEWRENAEEPRKIESPEQGEEPVPSGLSALEVADLRERYQRAVTERDSLAAALEQWKQAAGSRYTDSERLSQLDETLRAKDAQVESLLWQVAELEPVAAAVPQLEEELRRRQAAIAGHEAMRAENADHVRSLLNRVAELESEIVKASEWDKARAEREAALRKTLADGQAALQTAVSGRETERRRTVELGQMLARREAELSSLAATRAVREKYISELEARIKAAESMTAKILELEAAQREQDAELQRLVASLEDRDAQSKQLTQRHESQLAQLHQVLDGKNLDIQGHQAVRAELENMLTGKDMEIHRLYAANVEKDAQMASLNERLSALEVGLTSAQERLTLQEEQSRVELRTQLESLQARHQFELARLRTTLAQRLRRVSQGL
jgi:chromosome segregation ATPase